MYDLYLQRVCLYFLQVHSLALKEEKHISQYQTGKYSTERKQENWYCVKISMTNTEPSRYNLKNKMDCNYKPKLQMSKDTSASRHTWGKKYRARGILLPLINASLIKIATIKFREGVIPKKYKLLTFP